MKALLLCLCAILVSSTSADSVWPKPLNQTTSDRVLYLDIDKFHFKSIGSDSLILQRAFERYEETIFGMPAHVPVTERSISRVTDAEQGIHRLKVYVASNDQSLNLQTDESYALIISAPTSSLEANSIYGALRGLETFSQLIERIDTSDWAGSADNSSSSNSMPKGPGEDTDSSSSPAGAPEDAGKARAPGSAPAASSAPAAGGKLSSQYRRSLQGQSGQGQGRPFGLPVGVSVGLSPQAEARNPNLQPATASGASGGSTLLSVQQRWLAGHPQNAFWDADEAEEGSDEWPSSWDASGKAADEDDSSDGSQDPTADNDGSEDEDSADGSSDDSQAPTADEDDSEDGDSPDDSDDDSSDGMGKHHKHKKHHKHHKKHHKKHRKRHGMMYTVNATAIWDSPRFAHRGLLLDSSRHFLPIDTIKVMGQLHAQENLDAMASVKMNVLHWHIVDDQSYPYQSNALPRLSEYGAYSPAHIYLPGDVGEVVEYARDRGIRVIPEFDTPGHTASWGKGYPELLTDCYDATEQPTGVKGPINPARNETYALLWKLLREAAAVFPDSYIHLGGDEVPFDCWQSSPEIKAFMADNGLKDTAALETYFEGRVLGLARQAGRNYIVWQEILDNGVEIAPDTVVHVWKWWMDAAGKPTDLQSGAPAVCELSKGCRPTQAQAEDAGSDAWAQELAKVTSKGYKALLSSPWYLNLGQYAEEAWAGYYQVEPLGFNATPEQSALVIGGEACMWGEWTDATNVVQETWPRAAAIAERLWSARHVNDVNEARPRIQEHRCRLLARGIAASPGTGPGFCPTDFQAL